MIVATLALRNLARNRKSSLVLIGLVAVGVFLFVLGDAVLASASGGIRREFQEGSTGDLAVKARFERKFGIFGFSMPTIGEYEEMPALVDAPAIQAVLDSSPGISIYTRLVSGAALLEGPKGHQVKLPVFGVLPTYFQAFPSLRFVEGALPEAAGGAWIVLPTSRIEEIAAAEGRKPQVGDSLTFTMASGSAFTIRAVRLAGIVETPMAKETALAPAYTDPTTLRSLLGLSLGNKPAPANGEAVAPAGAGDIPGDFFSTEGPAPLAETEGEARGVDLVSQYLGAEAGPTASVDPEKGAWHFFLIRLKDGYRPGPTLRALNASLAKAGLSAEAVGWLSIAGLNASILYLLKTVFEIGIGVLAGIVILVLTNGLAFSVIEETKEIGTMRAMGAQRGFVSAVYLIRSVVLVLTGALVGLGLAGAVLALVGSQGIPISNSYLLMLFGSALLKPALSLGATFLALLGALFVAVISAIYPMALAMGTTVAQTMAAE